MEIRKLAGPLGAEVLGVDLRRELEETDFKAMHGAWIDNLVLVVRNQALETADQLRFAACFGELEEVRTKKDDASVKQYVMFVSNRIVEGSKGVLPDGEMFFHSDQCYYERPCQATMLNAMQLPSQGGETLFANMIAAFEALPDVTKTRILGRFALNVYDYDADPTKRNPILNANAPQYAHPIVRVHPVTGRKALYVNRQMTHHILGMEHEESEALLQELFAHAEHPHFVYEHRWQPYDLLVWDNRAVLHARRDFDPRESRILRRVTIKGTRPVAAAIP